MAILGEGYGLPFLGTPVGEVAFPSMSSGKTRIHHQISRILVVLLVLLPHPPFEGPCCQSSTRTPHCPVVHAGQSGDLIEQRLGANENALIQELRKHDN